MALEAGQFKCNASIGPADHWYSISAGSTRRASIILIHERANPALRAFSTAGKAARLHSSLSPDESYSVA